MDYKNWRHVFKIDPAKEISDEAFRRRFVNLEQMSF